jgi:hypothetical protein
MHMVWNVQSGTVEVKLYENEFTVHKGGIWQVPRGEWYDFPRHLVYPFLRTAFSIHELVYNISHFAAARSPSSNLWNTQTNQLSLGNTYSIRNVGSETARVFFAQACEMNVQEE